MISDDFYGDNFRWFIGVVKSVADDKSRVRVRIFGIHHATDESKVSNEDLPWALVMYPTTGGQTSSGNLSHGLKKGTWVVGFFVDGEDSQQPVVLGVINGGKGSVNNSPSGVRPGSSSLRGGNYPSSPTSNEDNQPSTTQLSGVNNANKTYNYFWERISKEAAYSGDLKVIVAAIVGNLQIESGSELIEPQAYNPKDSGAPAYGIAQWRLDRVENLFKFCGKNAIAGPPNIPPLEQQLDFMWHEMHTKENKAYNKLITSTTVNDATVAIIEFERDASYKQVAPKVWAVDQNSDYFKKKLNAANKVYSKFSYTGGAV